MALSSNTSLRTHLIRGASGALILNIATAVLALLMAVVLARVLGVKNFGIYAFCLSLVQILTVPAMLGGRELLVRELAAYQAKSEFPYLKGVLLHVRQASFLASIALGLTGAGIGLWAYQDNSPMLLPFILAMLLVPLHTTMQLQKAALRGLHHVLLAQAAITMRPAIVIVLVGIIFWMVGNSLCAEAALLAQIAGSVALVLLTFILLCKSLPSEAKKVNPAYERPRWIKSMLPFMFAGSMQILNRETSVFLLGIMQTPEEVGLFRVAQRGATL